MGKSCFTRAMIRAAAGFVGVLVLTAASSTFAADVPDSTMLFYNAHVFTAEPNAPYAEAVAIRGDRIVAVGALESVERAAGQGARRVDLGGRFLMPGMLDAHAHPIGNRKVLGGGAILVLANFPDTSDSLPDLVSFVGKTVDSRASLMGDTVIVNGIDIGYWSHAADIDGALSGGRFAEVPIVLFGSDGHTGWANKKARARAGITAAYLRKLAPAQRAYYGFGPGFAPNGFVVDVGLTRLRMSLPPASMETQLSFGRAGVHYLNALGITGWLDAAVAGVVGGDLPLTLEDPGALPVYRELARRGELTAHVAAYPVIRPNDGVQQLDVVEALRKQYADVPNLTIPGPKVFADGVVEYPSQTAALTKPYLNTGKSSACAVRPKELQRPGRRSRPTRHDRAHPCDRGPRREGVARCLRRGTQGESQRYAASHHDAFAVRRCRGRPALRGLPRHRRAPAVVGRRGSEHQRGGQAVHRSGHPRPDVSGTVAAGIRGHHRRSERLAREHGQSLRGHLPGGDARRAPGRARCRPAHAARGDALRLHAQFREGPQSAR